MHSLTKKYSALAPFLRQAIKTFNAETPYISRYAMHVHVHVALLLDLAAITTSSVNLL